MPAKPTTLHLCLLRGVTAHAMFCPACDKTLDCRRAVHVELLVDDKTAHTGVMCGKCFDSVPLKERRGGIAALLPDHDVAFDVIDGRVPTKDEWAVANAMGAPW